VDARRVRASATEDGSLGNRRRLSRSDRSHLIGTGNTYFRIGEARLGMLRFFAIAAAASKRENCVQPTQHLSGLDRGSDRMARTAHVALSGSRRFSFASSSLLPAQPLRVCHHPLSVLTHNLIARGASHEACTGLRGRLYFFTDHALGFAPSTLAASHQLRQTQPDHAV
jgi:hypothetical protein